MGDAADHLEESWDGTYPEDRYRPNAAHRSSRPKQTTTTPKVITTREDLLSEFHNSLIFRDAYLAAIRKHGCANTTDGVLLILKPCEQCMQTANTAFPGVVRRPEVFYRGNEGRMRCLKKGCNPILYGELEAREHRRKMGSTHRTAAWPKRKSS